MRDLDLFLSHLEKFRVTRDKENFEEKCDRYQREYVKLLGPVIGEDAAGDLFGRMVERCMSHSWRGIDKIGAIAAFFLRRLDDDLEKHLSDDEWDDIRQILEEESDEMDIDTLTELMDDLLARGKLG